MTSMYRTQQSWMPDNTGQLILQAMQLAQNRKTQDLQREDLRQRRAEHADEIAWRRQKFDQDQQEERAKAEAEAVKLRENNDKLFSAQLKANANNPEALAQLGQQYLDLSRSGRINRNPELDVVFGQQAPQIQQPGVGQAELSAPAIGAASMQPGAGVLAAAQAAAQAALPMSEGAARFEQAKQRMLAQREAAQRAATRYGALAEPPKEKDELAQLNAAMDAAKITDPEQRQELYAQLTRRIVRGTPVAQINMGEHLDKGLAGDLQGEMKADADIYSAVKDLRAFVTQNPDVAGIATNEWAEKGADILSKLGNKDADRLKSAMALRNRKVDTILEKVRAKAARSGRPLTEEQENRLKAKLGIGIMNDAKEIDSVLGEYMGQLKQSYERNQRRLDTNSLGGIDDGGFDPLGLD